MPMPNNVVRKVLRFNKRCGKTKIKLYLIKEAYSTVKDVEGFLTFLDKRSFLVESNFGES